MEGTECYLPVPEQHGVPCLGLYSMSPPFLTNSEKSTCFLALDLHPMACLVAEGLTEHSVTETLIVSYLKS